MKLEHVVTIHIIISNSSDEYDQKIIQKRKEKKGETFWVCECY